MALPHYKLHNTIEPKKKIPSKFPIILVPADPPRKWDHLKAFCRSRTLLFFLLLSSLVAGGSLLWMYLDPVISHQRSPVIYTLYGVLGFCMLMYIVSSLIARSETNTEDDLSIHSEFQINELPAPVGSRQPTEIELFCEVWSSEPYNEILDAECMAEIFNDDMLAPDHLVITLALSESKQ